MLILFYSSSMTYHQQTSVPFLEKYLANEPLKGWLSQFSFTYAGTVESVKTVGYFKFVEFFIRKAAHFGTYFLFGLFGYLFLQPKLQNRFITMIVTYLAATGYAALDEFHQMLTGDRTPLFQDVILDSLGALTAILLVMLFSRRKLKK
ncbi:VanZ family protein [Lactobacillus selangorensis]|nr:VanZ family protein [Lactobacillus selangorensis]